MSIIRITWVKGGVELVKQRFMRRTTRTVVIAIISYVKRRARTLRDLVTLRVQLDGMVRGGSRRLRWSQGYCAVYTSRRLPWG